MKRFVPLLALALIGCGAQTETPVIENQAVSSPRSTGATASLPADPVHGELTYLGVGAMAGTKDILANGTAVVWTFQDGTGRVSIQLNIAEAPQGKLYLGWLADDSRTTFEKLGTLQNEGGDVRHSLKLEAQKDFKRYTSVFVTLESSEGVQTPGPEVANGILKPTGR